MRAAPWTYTLENWQADRSWTCLSGTQMVLDEIYFFESVQIQSESGQPRENPETEQPRRERLVDLKPSG